MRRERRRKVYSARSRASAQVRVPLTHGSLTEHVFEFSPDAISQSASEPLSDLIPGSLCEKNVAPRTIRYLHSFRLLQGKTFDHYANDAKDTKQSTDTVFPARQRRREGQPLFATSYQSRCQSRRFKAIALCSSQHASVSGTHGREGRCLGPTSGGMRQRRGLNSQASRSSRRSAGRPACFDEST